MKEIIYLNRIFGLPHTKEEIIWNPLVMLLEMYQEALNQNHSKKNASFIVRQLEHFITTNKYDLLSNLKKDYTYYLKYHTPGHRNVFIHKCITHLVFSISTQLEGQILTKFEIPFSYQDKLYHWIWLGF